MQQRPINDVLLGIERTLPYTFIGILMHRSVLKSYQGNYAQ